MGELRAQLTQKETPYKDLSDEYKVYESFITTMLSETE